MITVENKMLYKNGKLAVEKLVNSFKKHLSEEEMKAVNTFLKFASTIENDKPVAWINPQSLRNFSAGKSKNEWVWSNPETDDIPIFVMNSSDDVITSLVIDLKDSD